MIERYNHKMEKKTLENNVEKQITGEWLYFCPAEITVRNLYEIFKETENVEIWEDAGVLEIPMGEKSSFDIETAQIHPKDEITKQFASEQQAKTVFLVTFMPEEYEKAEMIMKQIAGQFGGIFCGDTEDFMPQIHG